MTLLRTSLYPLSKLTWKNPCQPFTFRIRPTLQKPRLTSEFRRFESRSSESNRKVRALPLISRSGCLNNSWKSLAVADKRAVSSDSEASAHRFCNRLASEHSPYLLQHAHNPVDWYPWGEEAFEEARKRDVPIFLSIGYSTCHWCHVMEVESFEDEGVAKLLNDWFVSIKVDREERPDVDKVYMTYVQALYGGGGWPLSVFLSPDLKPLMGGTYFPPDDKYGRPGFKTILRKVKDAWENKRDTLLKSGSFAIEQLSEALSTAAASKNVPDELPETALRLCAEQL